jgi:soluble lytic murein transglycosylase-like protein
MTKLALIGAAVMGFSIFTTNAADKVFLQAIAKVESSNNPTAVGDKGKAIGLYQIWYVYWQDAVEYNPQIGGKYEDCFDPKYAEKVVIAYLNRYGKKAVKEKDYETLARIHCGGPVGHKKKATEGYWVKVRRHLTIK